MNLLMHRINNNYCLETRISIFPKTISSKPLESDESFLNKIHTAYVNNFMQTLVEIWPAEIWIRGGALCDGQHMNKSCIEWL